MKIACVYYENPAWPKFKWVAKTLQSLGHEVTSVHSLDELNDADKSHELTLFSHYSAGLNITDVAKIAETKQSFWCQWWFDLLRPNKACPYPASGTFDVHQKMLRAMDAVLLKEKTGLRELNGLGVKAHYMDQGVPTGLPVIPWVENPEYEIVLWGKCGSVYHQRREDIKFLVSKGYKVLWGGCVDEDPVHGVDTTEFIAPKDLAKFASRGRAIVNVDCTFGVDGFTSDRTWMTLMIGGASVIRDGNKLPWAPMLTYGSHESLLRHVDLICGHNDYRKELSKRAREWAVENVSTEKRCKEVLELCQRLRSQLPEPKKS